MKAKLQAWLIGVEDAVSTVQRNWTVLEQHTGFIRQSDSRDNSNNTRWLRRYLVDTERAMQPDRAPPS